MGGKGILSTLFFAALAGSTSNALVLAQQGGFGGGGFGGGGLGGGAGRPGAFQGGRMGVDYDSTEEGINAAIASYLSGQEVKNILTPGEFSEWQLTLKEGQVVIAEARSDAFDPALQIVEGQKEDPNATVLATNDDRWPGDQRPLLLWRCPKDGTYALRVRCFRDKSGGQLFARMTTYDSLNLGPKAEKLVKSGDKFLFRISMKKGQIKRIETTPGDPKRAMFVSLGQPISPIGLPDAKLIKRTRATFGSAICAPVDGDYYVMAAAYGSSEGPLRAEAVEVPVVRLEASAKPLSVKATAGEPAMWSLAVKKGDLLEASVEGLHWSAQIVASEEPPFANYDLKKDESNPFFPVAARAREKDEGPALEPLPARARDGRAEVFLAQKDMRVWLSTNGFKGSAEEFTLTVKPAALALPEAAEQKGKLRIGKVDYWVFDAKAGDIMALNAGSTDFAGEVLIRDPGLDSVWGWQAHPDQTSETLNHIVTKPGRYIVAVSAIGDGASGPYKLSRKTFRARAFGKGQAAKGNFSTGEAEVWTFKASPDEPLLVRWSYSAPISMMVCDENGEPLGLPLMPLDGETSYGILKADKPRTYVLVLRAADKKPEYTIELSAVPGYVPKQSKPRPVTPREKLAS